MPDREAMSVMVVDDNLSQRRTTAMILERVGYDVATAEDGFRALELASQRPFDAVLMDIRMPTMNGVETFRRLKKIIPDATVIMMTAYTVEDLVQEALAEGACEVLYKPLDIDLLLSVLRQAHQIGHGSLILIVDDHPSTCNTLRRILGQRGYEVGVAHSGEEAIAAARERGYDLVLLDVKLPTLDGLQTYLALKEISPKIIAIIITGYYEEMAGVMQRALDKNAYACLRKPLEISRLLELIEEALMQQRAGGGTVNHG